MNRFESLMNRKIGLNESFTFQCLQCGHCCRGREDILLSPIDLYRMANAMHMTPNQILDQYCESYNGPSSHLPLVRLKAKGEDRACPLLHSNRCAAHKGKPLVCALYPLGRIYNTKTGEVIYALKPVACGGKGQKQTVQEWLKRFNLDGYEDAHEVWHKLTSSAALFLNRHKASLHPDIITVTQSLLYMDFYSDYQLDQPLFVQLKQRADSVQRLLTSIDPDSTQNES